ncbi:hypothetical protein [Janthinobacterium sp. NKUCC06_STL]|uniref:hypothetical protein n=1 Tax=Janthinobacterium sp. NKUCC06_STL TaxID=2842127 RepID=UPI001C5A6E0A|nr:hypothetical protein [Janthinobacterium sp. NKUCC06_STL]MBW3512232.1 hypothetical protein [Janthinobacterium sp. NKUCC06_STL]
MSAKLTPSVDYMYFAAQWLDVYAGAEDAEAVVDVVDRWQQGKVVFVGPATFSRVIVIKGA